MTHVLNLMADCKTPGGAAGWAEHVPGRGFQKYRPVETWAPAVNLYEDDNHYFAVVDLAGVEGPTIKVFVDDQRSMVTISGHREMPDVEGVGALKLHLMEIDHGDFSRTVNLPSDVDHKAIDAVYKGGFLRIQIPKK
jgi:HSP20 family protein